MIEFDLTAIFRKIMGDGPLNPVWRREFESELVNTIGFGGLRPIRRIFV